MKNKYFEVLEIYCNERYELDIFLEKYPQVRSDWYNSEEFKNNIKEVINFENKYGNLPVRVLQKIVDKETPMKPKTIKQKGYKGSEWVCPNCKRHIAYFDELGIGTVRKMNYCDEG